ncbi:hypothetical protein B0J13DRAFT_302773 [Dactylonectria estremocensis]|uniref:Developmental regulatory protein wetA n=1 Tax=Dactylonectria estremocensis TaxID=1079267 RepID=A0A9P9J8G3_9HYPO|nr:hypothetical protein B0J13DRAFT_302773 [Dactylonectria estremocensis]
MAWAALPYRVEAVDRDPGFCWQDLDDGPNDGSNDFFGQFIDFEADIGSSMANPHGMDPSLPTMPDPLMLDQPSESTVSSGVSTAGDEFDFFSHSSQIGPVMSSHSVGPHMHEVDPQSLAIAIADDDMAGKLPRASISDPELPRLEGISLHSPSKRRAHISQPSSPKAPNTITATARRPNKFVEALSSTIRRAGKFRRGRKASAVAVDRPGSPTMENPPMALRVQAYEYSNGNEAFPPSPTTNPDSGAFVHGYCDDPFSEPPSATSLHFFGGSGMHTPAESPIVKSEPVSYRSDLGTQGDLNNWPLAAQNQPQLPQHEQQQLAPQHIQQQPRHQAFPAGCSAPESWPAPESMTHGAGWWDLNLLSQNGEYIMDPQQQQYQRHANLNMAMHAQHAELPYEYQAGPDPAGLMIHMPQPRGAAPAVINDLSVSGQTYLPPPPPLPMPGSERPHRPPRAPSSGARHLSCSPIRKTRAPSASPQPAHSHSRHSSGGSIGSVRSASGRGMVPGTPTTIRKQRRSRDLSGSSAAGAGGGEIGFVNFTPSDGGMLMTGVAPSGSSKTKARREREAMERRRRLSEAALKAVQAAGGDVDQLMQQGFAL